MPGQALTGVCRAGAAARRGLASAFPQRWAFCAQFLKGLGMPIEEFMPKEPPPPPEPSAAKPVEKKGMLARLTKVGAH